MKTKQMQFVEFAFESVKKPENIELSSVNGCNVVRFSFDDSQLNNLWIMLTHKEGAHNSVFNRVNKKLSRYNGKLLLADPISKNLINSLELELMQLSRGCITSNYMSLGNKKLDKDIYVSFWIDNNVKPENCEELYILLSSLAGHALKVADEEIDLNMHIDQDWISYCNQLFLDTIETIDEFSEDATLNNHPNQS